MTHQALCFLVLGVAGWLVSPIAANAQAQSSPAPSANSIVWHNPPNTNLSIIDPCGGPKELLNKINPSPCVLVEGEAMFWAGYANVNVHGNVNLSGPQNGFELPVSGNANIYPNLSMAFGVSASSQLQITMPSDVNVGTQRFGTTAGTTNLALDYKQLVYFSQTKFTPAAVDLGYLEWSPAPGSFAFFPIVSHNFNPNRTTLIADAAQLFGRVRGSNGGLDHQYTFGGTATPRLFAATVYYLMGESNLPPTPAAPAPTATP